MIIPIIKEYINVTLFNFRELGVLKNEYADKNRKPKKSLVKPTCSGVKLLFINPFTRIPRSDHKIPAKAISKYPLFLIIVSLNINFIGKFILVTLYYNIIHMLTIKRIITNTRK